MWSLPPILLLTFAVDASFGYSLAPSLLWPEEYHFNAEEINLGTGIVKPFEIWYSTKHNRSRIDLYGGTISRYYYGMWYDNEDEEHSSKIYMIHPSVSEDDSEVLVECDLMSNWDDDQKDFLPSIEEFKYSGTQEHEGKQVQVWTREQPMMDVMVKKETLLVAEVEDEVGIPLHHYTKILNFDDGSLDSDIVVNYYNYDDKIPVRVLDAKSSSSCSKWSDFDHDFHRAVDYLHPSIDSDVEIAFKKFKGHHKRAYFGEEHKSRRAIFKRNWDMITDHNSQNLGYKLGLNQFADKTKKELAYLNAVKVTDPIREGTHKFPHTDEEISALVEEIPEEFDLRALGVLSPVRNQAHCGSCWAFAMASTMEGALARNNGGRVIDLSEQSLVDCAWAFKSHGCKGTEAIDAVFYYVMEHGIPTVQEYGKYLEEDGFCKINNMTKVYKIKGFAGVTLNSPNALRYAVYNYGPVTIGVLVTEKMQFYRSGVFYDVECMQGPMNHAVTLVGYGVRNGDLYWIVKNSWGESWGESGYILMSAKNNNCNVMTSPYYPVL